MHLFVNNEIEFTEENGFDENIRFLKKACSSSTILSLHSSESEELSESSYTKLDTTVTPFNILWCFGVNITAPFINLTKKGSNLIFFASSHDGVLYNYETREMAHLQGHQNAITSMTVEKSGKYLATADSGEENCIIVWKLQKCKPVCTIFNANEGSGTALLSFSGSGRYLVSVSDEAKPVIKFWLWTCDSNDPYDELTVSKASYGKPITIRFNPIMEEHFMIAFEKQVMFLAWDPQANSMTEEVIPTIRNRGKMGKITDCTYIEDCHECIAVTNEGCAVVFGNALYVCPFKSDDVIENRKIYMKTVKISSVQINCVKSVDDVIATGDIQGFIKFYDKRLKILYWCQSFNLPPIINISFNLEPRKYKFEDPTNLADEHFRIPSPRKILDEDFTDVSEEYEILYKNLAPSDATLHRHPFIVRNFILSTADGNLVKVDYIENSVEEIFNVTDAEVAAIDIHEESPYIVIAYKNGRVSLYHYQTHELIRSAVLPKPSTKVPEKEQEEFQILEEKPSEVEEIAGHVTVVKYSPKCYHLAVGRSNGEIWFLDPIMMNNKTENPTCHTYHSIKKITFDPNNKYFAYFDSNRMVCIYIYVRETDGWVSMGKIRSHYKPLADLIFSSYSPPELFSIGLDRYLVKYDLEKSRNDGQIVLSTRIRIDQSSTPNAFIFYPLLEGTHLLIADNQFKLKVFDTANLFYRHVFLGPSYGCYSEAPIRKMSILPHSNSEYLMFCTEKHMGMQKLPPDGNPYKYTGTIGHPVKLLDFMLSPCGRYIFTAGEDDCSVLMWQINVEAVENLTRVGGKELEPFYCLIEGGASGWLFTEMQNLFYYMQILHQGENSQLPRNVSDCIALTEVPDLMRACGYYPSEYEVDIMINDAKAQNCDAENEEISFINFVKLYINHRPAHGISMSKLNEAFTAFCELGECGDSHISGEEFADLICRDGEKFTKEAAVKCLSILLRCNQDEEDDADEEEELSFVPDDINFEVFVGDILGIDMERSIIN